MYFTKFSWVFALLCEWVRSGVACSGLLLCRSCGHEVAEDADVRFVPSRLALSHRNDTVIGGKRVSVQLFENPQGFRFEVVTFKKADVLKHWPADSHFSWYPGFSWTFATCPRCKTHMGWAFQPSDWPSTVTREEFEGSDQTFVSLIADRLLQEHFASTLLMTPKSFRS
ncbi:hypothetical protein E1301_Tti020555 [Triplophysa tibetana]|uniref:CULT domain-containing protein n=1 Tax=Triplophysa tibetana TaxID=1572043 RepID=A0A5A9P0A8_9TELE|nr:hypothetical protein E1301_Tti020555 [Triplophysa tibetana]